jgi:anti-repressor protein
LKLVYLESNRPVTDSLTVAETFGKRHDNVLRDIKELECSKEFSLLNFEETPYTAQNGQSYVKYLITQDGFSFLVMGYTGREAARFKELYIAEFKKMREELNKPQFQLPQNYVEALEALIGAEKDKIQLQEQNAYKDQQIAIQAPKVALYDVAMSADGVQPVGTVAKELGLGRTRLFALLREKKILRSNNEPYQEYIERGYFKLRMYTITHYTNGLENKTQPMVTPKGIAWLHKILKEGA